MVNLFVLSQDLIQKSAIFLKITPEWALEPKQFCARHREPIHAGRLVVALAPEFG